MRLIYLFFFISACYGCSQKPIAKITDQYIEIIKPGQDWALVEIKVLEFDSTLQLPSKEEFVTSFIIVNRITKKKIIGNDSVKMFFSKKNTKFQWAQLKSRFSNEYEYSDTIGIKPYTWYSLSTEKYMFDVYFFWDKSIGTYETRYKPKPGAY